MKIPERPLGELCTFLNFETRLGSSRCERNNGHHRQQAKNGDSHRDDHLENGDSASLSFLMIHHGKVPG